MASSSANMCAMNLCRFVRQLSVQGKRQGPVKLSRLFSTTPTTTTESSAEGQAPIVDPAEFAKLKEENEKLVQNVKELDDKYKRSLADSENLRMRLLKQIEDTKAFGIQKFCTDLLEVADVLQTACGAVPKDEVDKNSHLKNLFEGLQLTESQLQGVFRRHGLTQINPLGEKFNPNEHEAVFMATDKNKEQDSVAVVSKLGYRLKDRVIRPALVGVVKH
ncbi:grpE protein -like protein [Tropilaelaps mercedesae]|uniref:GrpE protein homolog n=1 Tax=Tropilaelaps mercedesae TaxID=418985 RepID=A0A1V9XHM2_9ACAR|nr:grpE protein -like protein [Tropilaelaps mercedesae]